MREIILSERQTLPMQVNDLTLHLRPQSFFQTNTKVTEAIYAQGREWVREGGSALAVGPVLWRGWFALMPLR